MVGDLFRRAGVPHLLAGVLAGLGPATAPAATLRRGCRLSPLDVVESFGDGSAHEGGSSRRSRRGNERALPNRQGVPCSVEQHHPATGVWPIPGGGFNGCPRTTDRCRGGFRHRHGDQAAPRPPRPGGGSADLSESKYRATTPRAHLLPSRRARPGHRVLDGERWQRPCARLVPLAGLRAGLSISRVRAGTIT